MVVGHFPIDSKTNDYNAGMVKMFNQWLEAAESIADGGRR